MGKKKIKKDSLKAESHPQNEIKSSTSLPTLDLSKYCTKKLFQVTLISEMSPQGGDLLENVVNEGKKFESISFTHFITYKDVMEMVQRFTDTPENIELPKTVKECWNELSKIVALYLNTNESLPFDILAQIVKIKIAEEMYKTYKAAVIKMMKRKRLEEELDKLAKCDEPKVKVKGKNKKNKGGKKDKSTTGSKGNKKEKSATGSKGKKGDKSKSTKTTTTKNSTKVEIEPVIEDYTEIPLENNEIIFDYNIDNQVQFFVLVGFQLDLVEELFKVNVPLCSIIKFYLETPNHNQPSDQFEQNVNKLFNFPLKFLENTPLMKFTAVPHHSSTEIFEKLLYVVKRINYIKRQHLSYIKNLTLHDFGPQPLKWFAKCLENYNKNLDKYPLEIVNIALILDNIIAEVSSAVGVSETVFSSLGSSTTSTTLEDSCLCPSASKEFFSTIKQQPKTYRVHQDDFLNMTLNSYKNVGTKLYETTLKYLKLTTTQSVGEKIELEPNSKRKRDFGAPSEDYYCSGLEEIVDIVHLALFSGMQRCDLTPQPPPFYDFSENLDTYCKLAVFNSLYPQGDEEKTECHRNDHVISEYFWKEDLGQSALLQLFFKNLTEFSSYTQIFCEETENILVKFHDNLDDFGIGVKIYDQSLRTPVSLRDFCKYVAVEKGDWLEDNRVLEHVKMKDEDLVREDCQGLTILRSTGLYEEYSKLFGNHVDVAKPGDFHEILEELIGYPTSENLVNFCSESGNESTFVAYDLGPGQLQLIGANIIFNSFDGVKITVDSGRFLDQPPQCCIKVTTNDNMLVFWSKNPRNFHFVLFDETIIRFSQQSKFETTLALDKSNNVEQPTCEEEEAIRQQSKLETVDPCVDVEQSTLEEKEAKELEKNEILLPVVGVSRSKFPPLTPGAKENYEEILEKLKISFDKEGTIYKIFRKRPTKHLKRKNFQISQPLYAIINRIFFKRPKIKKIKSYSMEDKRSRSTLYDLQLILPNGLTITSLPPNRGLMEVKQSHQNYLKGEKFRIFYKTGTILVKNTDGSVKIFKSNGDFIELSEETCFYLDFNESEKISKILAKFCNNDVFYPSRGPYSEESEGLINFCEFGKIPYNKKTLLDFNGKQTTEHKEKTITKQLYHVVDDNDFSKEEKYFERDDGMTSLIDRNGKKQIEFVDGTRITAWYEVENEMVYAGDPSKYEGWVSVVICYEIQHPNYATIIFNDVAKSTEICLNNRTIIANFSGIFVMDLGDGVAVDVSPESILVAKLCQKCKCEFICKINKNQEYCLLEVMDTYNKTLTSDSYGNCNINSNYIKGDLNRMKCNHRQLVEEQKFFVLDPVSFSGFLFRPNWVAEMNLEDDVTRYYNKLTKRENLEIFKKNYQNFNEKFWIPKKNLCLTKLRKNEEGFVYYQTFRILSLIYDSNNCESLAEMLSKFLETNSGLSQILIDRIFKVIRYFSENEAAQKFRTPSLDVTSIQLPVKENVKTVNEIIDEWKQLCEYYLNLIRSQKYPPYFQSVCYEEIMASIT